MRARGAAALVMAGVLAGCGSGDKATTTTSDVGPTTSTTESSLQQAAASQLSTTLAGRVEVPGPGDPDGAGFARVAVQAFPDGEKLCYEVQVSRIDTPTAAHIHKGKAGAAGPIVVQFRPPVDASSGPTRPGLSRDSFIVSECMGVDAALRVDIMSNPGDYYVNVHTKAFPNGAVRGQLVRGAP